jgi:hypothetical protein
MKLRVQNNSIRLRLTRTEVEDFERTGRASASIQFGGGSTLTYALQRAKAIDAVLASFPDREIHVRVPEAMAHEWATGDQVGVEGRQTLDNGEQLEIVIEKDFQCLHKGEDAKDPDAYPNPLHLPL